eukprot:19497_1
MMLNSNSNTDELDDNVQKGIDKMDKRFKEIELMLNDLMGNQLQSPSDVTNGMNAIEKAKYYATLAYSIQTLYNIHLRLKNEETRIASSNVEINRAKQTILKIKNVLNVTQNDDDNDIDLDDNHNNSNGGHGPRMRLDKAAAKRFIAHNVDKDTRDKMHEQFGDEMKRKDH